MLLQYCPYLILIAFAVVVRVGSFYVPYLLRHLTQNPFHLFWHRSADINIVIHPLSQHRRPPHSMRGKNLQQWMTFIASFLLLSYLPLPPRLRSWGPRPPWPRGESKNREVKSKDFVGTSGADCKSRDSTASSSSSSFSNCSGSSSISNSSRLID